MTTIETCILGAIILIGALATLSGIGAIWYAIKTGESPF